MTDNQKEKIKLKIEKYKKALADDKKFWHGYYHDGQGIRYVLPAYYIQLEDYKGGLRYFNWFDKNFPDDSCYANFYFEWAFVLYKSGKLPDAEKKLHLTYFSNIYLIDKFLEKDFTHLDANKKSSWEFQNIMENFEYNKNNEAFIEFSNWVEMQMQAGHFLTKAKRLNEINNQLETEDVGKLRTALVNELYKLKYD